MKTDLVNLLGYLNTGFGFFVALILLLIGVVAVRPAHGTAGLVLAGGAGARIGGAVLVEILVQMRSHATAETRTALSALTTLLSLVTDLAFWGAIVGAAILLARAVNARGGQPS